MKTEASENSPSIVTSEKPKTLTGSQVVVGLLFGIVGIAAMAWITNESPDAAPTADNKAALTAVLAEVSSMQAHLQESAIALLHDQNGALCDPLYDAKLTDVTYGTMSAGGRSRFPAILAHYDYMCRNGITGDPERNTTFWVFFGYDEISQVYRCHVSAMRSIVEETAAECDFRHD